MKEELAMRVVGIHRYPVKSLAGETLDTAVLAPNEGLRNDRRYAFVGGGKDNQATGLRSTISGGLLNTASGITSTISGGQGNQATGTRSVVGGGLLNVASAPNATVPGGTSNTAAGNYSGTLSFRTSDADESLFNFTLSGEVLADLPEITHFVAGLGTTITTGRHNQRIHRQQCRCPHPPSHHGSPFPVRRCSPVLLQ